MITDARSGTSSDLTSRQKRYAITMAFRTACFIAMIFVPGPLRWVLFAGAVFLPYIAVIFANQANQQSAPSEKIEPGAPESAAQITTGPEEAEIIDSTAEEDTTHSHGGGLR